jgi:hypothetical protein
MKKEVIVLFGFLLILYLSLIVYAQNDTLGVMKQCYSSKDCPQSAISPWCDGDNACQELAVCSNPETTNSTCSITKECVNCINIGYLGCKDGQCQKINCYKDEDCGQSITKKYCSGSQACIYESINHCYNSGTIDSSCIGTGGAGCSTCAYGCSEGVCLGGTNQTYPCGQGNDGQSCPCVSQPPPKPSCSYSPAYNTNRCLITYKETCETAICKDTDGGINYYVKGSVMFGEKIAATDSCENAITLREEGCVPNPKPNEGTMFTNIYKCPNGCSDGACIKGEKQKEEVKCIFKNTKTEQKCYVAEKNWMYCSTNEGICIVTNLEGYDGEKITWKSSCGGYSYTILDGNNEQIEFDCSGAEAFCQSKQCPDGSWSKCYVDGSGYCVCSTCSPIIIKPVCGNGVCESGEWQVCEAIAETCQAGQKCEIPKAKCYYGCEQDCKTIPGVNAKLNEQFKLQVGQTVKITDYKEIKIIFRDLLTSSCEASVTNTEEVKQKLTGMAVAETTPSTEAAGGGGGGVSIIKCPAVGPMAQLDIVNPEEQGGKILTLKAGEAKNIYDVSISFIEYDFPSRTGIFIVNSKPVTCPGNCKCDSEGYILECKVEEKCEQGKMMCQDGKCREECEITNLTLEECKSGCIYGNKCLPIGVRVKGSYCSIDTILTNQLNSDEVCENNFECKSNVCVNGKCISGSLIQKVINWFKKLFGGGAKTLDCGTSTECWENAFKECKPAKISQGGVNQESELSGMVIEIIGLEGEKCVVKWTAKISGSEESMTCKFENYALGKDMISGSMEQYCSGPLTYRLAATPKTITAIQG